jgi:citrate lyase subunit alpha / citrate CoA-transferase
MIKNSAGRLVPEEFEGKMLRHYEGPFKMEPTASRVGKKMRKVEPGQSKLKNSLEEAILAAGLKDGMTISFHHHFRDGDYIVLMVLEAINKLGIKDLVLAPSSLTDAHDAVVQYLESGMIRRIESSGLRGKLGQAISKGLCKETVIIRSHGGRVRAIESGELKIDVAFLGVPACDEYGNANGYTGKSVCGSLGYAIVDSKYAEKVVLITDNLVPYPCTPISIEQTNVDYVVQVNEIGDGNLIASNAARISRDPRSLLVARNTAKAIMESGYFKEGFSMQTGAGSISLAVTVFLGDEMKKQNIKASFALGGIGGAFVKLHEDGYIRTLMDTQSFDLVAAKSLRENKNHVEIDTGFYANPHNGGAIVNKLDVVVLAALEIDVNFNVNTLTGVNGELRGAVGGHQDTAAAANLAIIVAPLVRGRIPSVVKEVNNLNTPGESVDLLVTDYGMAVNPLRQDLIEKFKKANLPLKTIEELQKEAEELVGIPKPIKYIDDIVALVQYRDGSTIDVIKKLAND